MKIKLDFTKKIKNGKNEDKDLGEHLTAGLEAAVASSEVAKKLLDPILKSDKFEVVIKDGGATATSGQRVTINVAQVNAKDAKTADDLKEFIESTMFELVNAKNFEVFAKLEKELKEGKLPILGDDSYGRTKADLEAEASWTVKDILKQRQAGSEKYVPSKWGTNTINGCSSKSTLNDFKPVFRAAPHDKDAKDKTPEKLPTEQFYAYKGAVTLGGTSKLLDKCFKNIEHKKAAKQRVSLQKLFTENGLATKQNTQNPIFAALIYHVAMSLVLEHDDISVKALTAGTADQWKLTDKMKEVAPDGNGTLLKQFVDLLNDDKRRPKTLGL